MSACSAPLWCPTLFLFVKRAHPVLGLAIVLGKVGKCLLSFAHNRLANLVAPRLDADLEEVWTHVEAISTQISLILGKRSRHLRVVEDVHRYRLPAPIKRRFDLESPHQPRDCQPSPLLRKRLS